MIQFSNYDMKRDISRNEHRDFFLNYAFRGDTDYTGDMDLAWNHGLLSNSRANSLYSGAFRKYIENFNFSDIFPFCVDVLYHGHICLVGWQWDFLKEHVDLNKLSTFIKIKNELVPFYGKMLGIQYLQQVLYQNNLTSVLSIAWCFSSPMSLFELYKCYKQRGNVEILTESYFDCYIKMIMRECLFSGFNDDEVQSVLFYAMSHLLDNWFIDLQKGHIGMTIMEDPSWAVERAIREKSNNVWDERGVSESLRLIRNVDGTISHYITDDRKIKQISFENLKSEKTGQINLNAYSILASNYKNESPLSFEECMSELWLSRGI